MATNRTKRLPPRKVSRSKSSDKSLRDILTGSLSFNKKSSPLTHHQKEDECNIFGSDMVTREFIVENLKKVKDSCNITKLEIEDLLCSHHHLLLPMVKALLLGDDRDWRWVKFVDFINSDELLGWQSMKSMLIHEYSTTSMPEEGVQLSQLVSFHANIRVEEGKCIDSVLNTFKAIYEERDNITSLSFTSVSLAGVATEALPPVLGELFGNKASDEASEAVLQEAVTIHVISGVPTEEDKIETSDLLRCCIAALNKKGSIPQKEGKSAPTSAKHLVRRTKSFEAKSKALDDAVEMAHAASGAARPPTRNLPVRSKSFSIRRSVSLDEAVASLRAIESFQEPSQKSRRSLPPRAKSFDKRSSGALNATMRRRQVTVAPQRSSVSRNILIRSRSYKAKSKALNDAVAMAQVAASSNEVSGTSKISLPERSKSFAVRRTVSLGDTMGQSATKRSPKELPNRSKSFDSRWEDSLGHSKATGQAPVRARDLPKRTSSSKEKPEAPKVIIEQSSSQKTHTSKGISNEAAIKGSEDAENDVLASDPKEAFSGENAVCSDMSSSDEKTCVATGSEEESAKSEVPNIGYDKMTLEDSLLTKDYVDSASCQTRDSVTGTETSKLMDHLERATQMLEEDEVTSDGRSGCSGPDYDWKSGDYNKTYIAMGS